MKDYSCFKVLTEKNISHVMLNRPEKRNSMNLDFWNEFPEIVSTIDEKGTTRANHYHPIQEQKCLVTRGQFISVYQDLLNKNSPKYIITERNDYSFNCLKQKTSKYKLLTTSNLNKNNIFIFKRNYQ